MFFFGLGGLFYSTETPSANRHKQYIDLHSCCPRDKWHSHPLGRPLSRAQYVDRSSSQRYFPKLLRLSCGKPHEHSASPLSSLPLERHAQRRIRLTSYYSWLDKLRIRPRLRRPTRRREHKSAPDQPGVLSTNADEEYVARTFRMDLKVLIIYSTPHRHQHSHDHLPAAVRLRPRSTLLQTARGSDRTTDDTSVELEVGAVQEGVGAGRPGKGSEAGRLIAHHYHMAHTRSTLEVDFPFKLGRTIPKRTMRWRHTILKSRARVLSMEQSQTVYQLSRCRERSHHQSTIS
jgi:hypothetical protein